MGLGEILEGVEKLKKALKLVDLYEVQIGDKIITAEHATAKELRDSGYTLLRKIKALEISWEGETYLIKPSKISRTVEQALKGEET